MLENIEVLYHSSIKISKEKVIYIDPYEIKEKNNDADIIFITHDHFDHYSEEDIDKIKKENTTIIVPETLKEKVIEKGLEVIIVKPNKKYSINGIDFETIPAYNVNKSFHPKENGWIGYNIEINGIRYYIAGDTDKNEDNIKVKCDVALVPVGGTYTMNYKEAAEFINEIQPQIAIPTHYGSVAGSKDDGEKFVQLLDEKIEGKILMK